MTYNYCLTIAYEGTEYAGWQMQTNAPSVQQLVQDALALLLKHRVHVTGSGRTDAGVHAAGQMAHFKSERELELSGVLYALNGMLPQTIRVKRIQPVPLHFHARYSAISKEYHYHLHLDPAMDPFRRLHLWHLKGPMDAHLLHKAANLFVGTHDFTTFANSAHQGSAAKDPVKTIYRIDVVEQAGGLRLEFEGNGFLYRMVRNITGTIVEVGQGKRPLECIPELLKARDRKLAARAAPAKGLFLVRVNYPEEFSLGLLNSSKLST